MSGHYFNKDDFNFRKAGRSLKGIFFSFLKLVLASVSLAVVYYVVFALFFSTEEELMLKRENDVYESVYPEMKKKEELVSDVVSGLEARDGRIYQEIFGTSVPVSSHYGSGIIDRADSLSREVLVAYTGQSMDRMEKSADRVDSLMSLFFGCDTVRNLPPMTSPVRDMKYTQAGASVGMKINPFYKLPVRHDGFDIIAASGTPVYAAASGIVTSVERSGKGLGNVVTVDHGNGYVTRYAHLSDITVRRGRRVTTDTRIGYVGVSGKSFAPHLHYEVLKDGDVMDPVHYMFLSAGPDEYAKMVALSSSVGQSMD